MSWISKTARRLSFLFHRTDFEGGMDEEMQFHLEMKTREYVAAGLSPEEARAAAMRSFGNVPLLKEDSREIWGWRWLEDLLQDLRFSARLLAKTPGFTLVVVLSLALGIGANTAIFSLINAVMLKMLPIKSPEQLRQGIWASPSGPPKVRLHSSYSTGFCPDDEPGVDMGCSFSYPAFEQVHEQSQAFSHVFTFTWAGDLNVFVNGQAALAQGELVSGDYFSGLGVQPLLGRAITPTDDQPGAPPVAVISYGYWERRFGGDPSAVGKTVALNGVPFTLVGVTPPEFFGVQPGNSPDIWVPLRKKPVLTRPPEASGGVKPRGQGLATFYRQVQERIEALPGVKSVSLSQYGLISQSYSSNDISIEGYKPKPQERMDVGVLGVGPKFFETMGIPLLLGRPIGLQDSETSPKVAVVSEAFARHYFPGQSPVGKRFGFGDKNPSEIEIVGVARNAKYSSLHSDWDSGTTVYVASLQKPEELRQMRFEVRTAGYPKNWVPAIRQAVRSTDKNVPLSNIKTQTEQIDETIIEERLFAKLTSFFGLLALGLACVGLYGTMSYAVVRRTNEIGLRMALGAQRRRVLEMVLKESLLLVAVGIALGLPIAFAATRLVKSFLFGLTPTDPVTLFSSTLVMAVVAALAGYLPARRAARVDPLVALRYE